MTKGVVVTFTLEPVAAARFDEIARIRGTNRSALMRNLMAAFIANNRIRSVTHDFAKVNRKSGSEPKARLARSSHFGAGKF
jgi:Ribbon-helix-helix protein, copG family